MLSQLYHVVLDPSVSLYSPSRNAAFLWFTRLARCGYSVLSWIFPYKQRFYRTINQCGDPVRCLVYVLCTLKQEK